MIKKFMAVSYWLAAFVSLVGVGGIIVDFGIMHYVCVGWCIGPAIMAGIDYWNKE